ncbi:conserved hypothetical protein [Culex quinquefasciatus]|uniref:Uncharacterized protein n=1 Tax=Culex quinquefasciatus TaxID=7176 RepID=B0WWN6_CULQU|nr:conserved hypothetical protein [Culex quinquefasciatus]|eukprot:XP_001861808.1 conserved hypothetical protein [Culex quinquefasciatus]
MTIKSNANVLCSNLATSKRVIGGHLGTFRNLKGTMACDVSKFIKLKTMTITSDTNVLWSNLATPERVIGGHLGTFQNLKGTMACDISKFIKLKTMTITSDTNVLWSNLATPERVIELPGLVEGIIPYVHVLAHRVQSLEFRNRTPVIRHAQQDATELGE